MAFKLLKHRWQKITLIVISAFIVLTLMIALFANSYFAPKLADKIKSQVLKSSDGLYRIDISNTELHILRGQAILYDIKLSVDTAVYNLKNKQGTAPNNLYELQVKRLVVSHMQLLNLYFKKKLNIGRITLNAPDVVVSYHPNQKTDTAKKDDKTLWQKISKSLKLINVDEIYLNDIKLKYKDYSGPKVGVSELKQMNLKATGLLIDSTTQKDTSRFLFCRDITTELHNYTRKTADGLYTFKVKLVRLSTQTSKLTVVGTSLIPIEHTAFFKKSKDDLFMLKLDTITIHRFDYLSFGEHQQFGATKVAVANGEFEDYSNYNGGLQTTDRVVTFPGFALRNIIKAKFNIDTLDLKRFKVTYKEYNKAPMKTGVIEFSNIAARFLNITNKAGRIAKNNICTANITSYFMGQGKFNLTFKFNLSDPLYAYSYKGHLAPMDIAAVNPALMPLSLVKITSGRVKSLDFDIHANQKLSSGSVSLLYNDLKLDILRSDYTKNTLLSLLANNLIIKHDNPDDGNNTPRNGKVVFLRPANFPFFKTVWQALLSGIKPCAGVGKAEEEKFKKQSAGDAKKEQEDLLKKAKKNKEKEDEIFKEALKKKRGE